MSGAVGPPPGSTQGVHHSLLVGGSVITALAWTQLHIGYVDRGNKRETTVGDEKPTGNKVKLARGEAGLL